MSETEDPVAPAAALTAGAVVQVELVTARVNFGHQQNDVPIVRRIVAANHGERTMSDLTLRIVAEPAFAQVWQTPIDRLRPGESIIVEPVDLVLAPAYLVGLSEREAGLLRVELLQNADEVASVTAAVEVLAHDEWDGQGPVEMLAAHVRPNDPAVEALLSQAARVKQRWSGDPTLDGYQSRDPKRVARMAAAVFTAIQDLDVTYVNPPASFEKSGQKVRSPSRILEARMGTCLDLAVLAAAALEQCGLRPIVVLVRGHAFVGVWLIEAMFADLSIDDAARLRTRVELGEICIFDPTAATVRPRLEFPAAVDEAKRRLADDQTFDTALDIARARKASIRPLPSRAEMEGAPATEHAPTAEGGAAAPALPREIGGGADAINTTSPPAETPRGRIERWKRKLLDLTRNNRLLNYRDSKTTIELLCPDLGQFEDRLARGAVFSVVPRPSTFDGTERDLQAAMRRTGEDPLVRVLLEQLAQNRLCANLNRDETDRRVLEIFRVTKSDAEESGANTLYLALGFLRWFEADASEQVRLAPILLLPLQIERTSVQEGFRIRLSDDEPRINVTLLEMLVHDFGLRVPISDPLPTDEHGLDVSGVLRTFRTAIRDMPRWEVVDRADIARLSFAKFLLWRDLQQRTDVLLQNRVVDHLVNRPDRAFESDAVFPDPQRLDDEQSPAALICPCDADSSQLAAVVAAAEGRSFVLEGPPGTGKSQTITNIVAQCLAQGRTVLFVAEKAAALNVVKSRLQRAGLGDFCLELHSNKARKLDVIQQLGRALRAARERSPEEWERTAAQLEQLRRQLNDYAVALHRERSFGESLYRVIDRAIGLRGAPRVALRWPHPESVDASALDALRASVERLAQAAEEIGAPARHRWAAVRQAEWSITWSREVERCLDALHEAASRLEQVLPLADSLLGLGDAASSGAGLELTARIAAHLLGSPLPHRGALLDPGWADRRDHLTGVLASGRQRDALRAELRACYRDASLQLPLDALHDAIVQAESTWFLPAWLRRRRVRRSLNEVAASGYRPATAQLRTDLEKLLALKREQQAVAAGDDDGRRSFGRYWNGGEPDWDQLAVHIAWIDQTRDLAAAAAGSDAMHQRTLCEAWSRLATDGGAPGGAAAIDAGAAELRRLRDGLEQFDTARADLVRLLDLDEVQAWGDSNASGLPGRLRAALTAWRGATRELNAWCAWRRARGGAIAASLEPLVAEFESGRVAAADLVAAFERSFYEWWVESIIDGEPVLREFRSLEHGRRIREFRRLDTKLIELAPRLARARLAARLPAVSETTSVDSEVGILQRELGKKTRHLPIRRLVERIPHLLPRLAPCLLMSPLSVAQYLDAGVPPFDVVVFDEASQIPVWDAVGAIARGTSAVIVGDPKQLPPTNFFSRADDDDAAEDDPATVVEDLESILDDCIAARLPPMQLQWHYRSRHESLIAFSNHHYYDNRLLTFPAAFHGELGVQWREVIGGAYDKGKSRTNPVEARHVVAELVRRLRDPEQNRHSVGVVTFSMAQQRLVEDLLDEERREDPSLDRFFTEAVDEPVFVKNLENVQGDERDVILFSICYGPDQAGKVSMNFGPLNRDGGERRLNVAVTRARREVLVFSTLRADQIDLGRTRAKGAAHLKSFLEYAEHGPRVLVTVRSIDADAECESPFEQQVHDALVARGWTVHRQVGCSGYRIDLAVVDPEAPGRYLLGIECDGANYHRAKTARDRDRLRALVLEGLGWRLHRIWSTDWWTDAEQELVKLERVVGEAQSAARRPSAPVSPTSVETVETRRQSAESIAMRSSPASAVVQPTIGPENREHHLVASSPSASEVNAQRAYRCAPRLDPVGDSEQFFNGPVIQLQALLEIIVPFEAPISLELAARRLAPAFGIGRVTDRALERLHAAAAASARIRIERIAGRRFLWPPDVAPDTYDGFRVAGDSAESERRPEDIHPREVANAAHHVLAAHISLSRADLMRETARLLGYQRTGRLVQESMGRGIDLLISTRRADFRGDRIVLSSGGGRE